MSAATVELVDGGVVLVVLNRPEQRNALSLELLREINSGLGRHLRRGKAKVVVLRGEGGYFCAGADLKEMAAARAQGSVGQKNLRRSMAELVYLCCNLRTLDIPTVALVQGGASGGGVGLLAACQWVIADENAKLCLPETKLGLFPFMISPLLIRRMGAVAFAEMALAAEPLSAAHAAKVGLVDEVVRELPEVRSLAAKRARPDTVWPNATTSGSDLAEDLAEVVQRFAEVPEHLRRAATRSALVERSMSLPIAMRTGAVELEGLVKDFGGTA